MVIKTIIGLILLLIPFLLIVKFKNKKLGFFYIFSFLFGIHLFIAIITQSFGIFNYGVIIGINIFIAVGVLIKTDFIKLKDNLKNLKIDWMLILIIIILGISLYSVHYNYTGKITTITKNFNEVQHMRYDYPYFSDEWSAVSLIKYSIGSGKLPLMNPLWPGQPFPNFELPFHSFISEMILLLDLDPLTQYTILSFFSGLIICLLVYFILRVNHIMKFPSAIACLSIPLILNGANLPGLWYLFPIILGMISLLLGFVFMSLKDHKMVLFMAFLTLIFYPPLFVLFGASLLAYFILLKINFKKKIQYLSWFFGICIFVSVSLSFFVFFTKGSGSEFISYVFSKIFYESFTTSAIPDYSIWKVIPIFSLVFSGIGVFKIWKKKIWLIVPVLVGLIYWVVYSRVLLRFIIEYQRVVFSSSILIIILSGFGMHYTLEFLKKIEFIKKFKIINLLIIIVLVLFFISSFSYTQNDDWNDLKAYSVIDDAVFSPAAPANNYLHEDDLRLFENITKKKFLSNPWKGLVIGVATNNYPLETKSSTITNKIFNPFEFMNLDCSDKLKISIKKEIDYVYLIQMDCEGFDLVGVSSEGLYLYEVQR